MAEVRLVEVDAGNWRACAAVHPNEDQRRWVADVTYYLCLCFYGDTWHPLAIEADGTVVGFLMWGVDDDASRWIGGLVVDAARPGPRDRQGGRHRGRSAADFAGRLHGRGG